MKYFFLTLLSHWATVSYAQISDNSKRDWIWPLGYDFYTDSAGIDGVTFDFSGIGNGDTMKITYEQQDFEMDNTNISLCDVDGNLLLYSNGCKFGNKNRNKILPDFTINNTNLLSTICYNESGAVFSRQMILLPDNDFANI